MKKIVLTLLKDEKRRADLKVKFPFSYDFFDFFYAFDKNIAQRYRENYHVKKMMTLSEISCSLGHLEILDNFLESLQKSIFILEDDIIGNDDDLIRIDSLVNDLKGEFILFVGGLNGLKGRKFLYGNIVDENQKIYKIPYIYHSYIARTCCYIITRGIATKISKKQHNFLDYADNWGQLLDAEDNVFFCDILQHPIDLSVSHIEIERLNARGQGFISKLLKAGIFVSLYWVFRKLFTRIIALLLGYRKI